MKLRQLVLVASLFIILPVSLAAQGADTVYVPAETESGDYYVNSLIEYVAADTNAFGEQLHKVYKLERGKLYVIDKSLDLKNPVELVAEAPVPYDAERKHPKILSNITEEGETATGSLIITSADITIKNIWLSGIDIGGVNHGWGTMGALRVNDSLVTVRLDGLWCDFNSWSAFGTYYPHTKWFINNFHARNEQNAGDQWTTFLFYVEGSTVIDTFIVTNSSYFQSNSCFLFPPSVIKYFEVDHCTFVNTLKWPFHGEQWILEAKITNNIFYNVSALSMIEAELDWSPDNIESYSIINVDTLYANEIGYPGPPGPYTIPEKDRIFILKNNCYYWSEGVEDYWSNWEPPPDYPPDASLLPMLWMNARTQTMFDGDDTWPGFIEENNWNVDPKFDDFPGLAEADELLVQACKDIRNGNTHGWDWDSDMNEYPDTYRLHYSYPLPEYFKSHAGLTGTEGYQVGDLTYYYYDPPTNIKETKKTIPVDFVLEQNYPNPFNPETLIKYSLPKSSMVRLEIYDIVGRRVSTLVNSQQQSGQYSIKWKGRDDNGSAVSSGIYFYKITAGSFTGTMKMMLVK